MIQPDNEYGALRDRALEWVLLLRSGRATTDDRAALAAWRDESPEHERAFVEAARLWRDLGTMAHKSEAGRTRSNSLLPRAAPFVATRRAVVGGALAAGIAGYLMARPPLGIWPSIAELAADYRTGKGEQRELALANDVSLTLNTQTSISVRADQASSHIELIGGEAAVRARRAGSSVFIAASGGEISATQAVFVARCLNDAVAVTCIEGTVAVEYQGRQATLQQPQSVVYSAKDGLGAPTTADVAQATAWQRGLLVFHDRPLFEVVEDVNRYRAGRIIVTNAQLGERLINGSFRLDQLDDVVAQIRQLFAAQVRFLPGGIVVLS